MIYSDYDATIPQDYPPHLRRVLYIPGVIVPVPTAPPGVRFSSIPEAYEAGAREAHAEAWAIGHQVGLQHPFEDQGPVNIWRRWALEREARLAEEQRRRDLIINATALHFWGMAMSDAYERGRRDFFESGFDDGVEAGRALARANW